jgi:hypothetical protein
MIILRNPLIYYKKNEQQLAKNNFLLNELLKREKRNHLHKKEKKRFSDEAIRGNNTNLLENFSYNILEPFW